MHGPAPCSAAHCALLPLPATSLSLQDNYFLDSASQINFFFEEKAFDESGKLQQPKELSINKIGHAMHDLDPVFR